MPPIPTPGINALLTDVATRGAVHRFPPAIGGSSAASANKVGKFGENVWDVVRWAFGENIQQLCAGRKGPAGRENVRGKGKGLELPEMTCTSGPRNKIGHAKRDEPTSYAARILDDIFSAGNASVPDSWTSFEDADERLNVTSEVKIKFDLLPLLPGETTLDEREEGGSGSNRTAENGSVSRNTTKVIHELEANLHWLPSDQQKHTEQRENQDDEEKIQGMQEVGKPEEVGEGKKEEEGKKGKEGKEGKEGEWGERDAEDPEAEETRTYTPAQIDLICASPSFALTPENFLLSYTGEFLKSYALEHANTSTFATHGLLASLAITHLDEPNLICGLNTPHRCAPTCASIIRKLSENLNTARSVYFAFLSAQHFAETVAALDKGLLAAQANVQTLAAEMAGSFFWTPGQGQDKWLKYALGMADLLIGQVAASIPRLATRGLVEGLLNKEIDKSQANMRQWRSSLELFTASMRANIEKGAHKAARAEKLKVNGIENGLKMLAQKVELLERTVMTVHRSGGLHGRGREEWAAMGVVTMLSYWKTRINTEFALGAGDGERGEGMNKGMLEAFIVGTTDATRKGLQRFAEAAFGGSDMTEEGDTLFSDLVYTGQFLPGGQDSRVGYYHSAKMEQRIKRAVILKTFNQALCSQPIYITCTPQFRQSRRPHRPTSEDTKNYPAARSCARDNTGPQDFKACVDGQVCYMYRWSDRGTQLDWHNERPYGKAVWSEEPWNIDITDVIRSSVLGAKRASKQSGAFNILDPERYEKSLDPATPGLFTIPVCFSEHAWSTVVDGHTRPNKWMHNLDRGNSIKSLPCNCGPWGRDTEAVWRDMGIWKDSKPKHRFEAMTCLNCGWQIRDKISDKLERYVAFCRVDSNALPGGKMWWAGKHPDCDTVTALLDQNNLSPTELRKGRPETYRALRCWIGLERKKQRNKGCERYMKMDLGSLLRIVEGEGKGRVIGGAESKAAAGGSTMEEHWRELEWYEGGRREFEKTAQRPEQHTKHQPARPRGLGLNALQHRYAHVSTTASQSNMNAYAKRMAENGGMGGRRKGCCAMSPG